MLVAIWIIAAILLGLWSLTAWVLHAVLTLGAGWAGDLKPLIEQIPYGVFVERWLPGWQDLLEALVDIVQYSLSWMGDSAPTFVWVLWGVGSALIGATAVGFTLMVVLLRKRMPRGAAGVAA